MVFRCLVFTLAVAICAFIVPVYSQINTPCSPPMITSFAPCLNLLMNGTANSSTTPTSDCCNFLKNVTSARTDCLCLIVNGSVPFQIPFNRSLVLSLPLVCGMPGVPFQCKAAAAAPISPTGPATLAPPPAPGSSSTVSDTTPDLTQPTTDVDSGVPTTNAGSRSTVTPSAAASTDANSLFILAASGATVIAYLMLF